MKKNSVQWLFLIGLILMLMYRITARLPFLPEHIYSFHTPKILKILTGLIFIGSAFFLYRKPSKGKSL
ncbi:hypothetical protein BC751_4315 [Cecembia calidifontis]|uniref:Uncharacterized protein n=1 Tax=Cecembia calidifontis TaxID=1187080 RepID=A0A4Q7PG11_9BACT|nr:hypothetical protein BC751_4315 [Cecembia calidifontis]